MHLLLLRGGGSGVGRGAEPLSALRHDLEWVPGALGNTQRSSIGKEGASAPRTREAHSVEARIAVSIVIGCMMLGLTENFHSKLDHSLFNSSITFRVILQPLQLPSDCFTNVDTAILFKKGLYQYLSLTFEHQLHHLKG